MAACYDALVSRPSVVGNGLNVITLKRLKAPGDSVLLPGASVYERRWLP